MCHSSYSAWSFGRAKTDQKAKDEPKREAPAVDKLMADAQREAEPVSEEKRPAKEFVPAK